MPRIGSLFAVVLPVAVVIVLAIFIRGGMHTTIGAYTTSLQGRSPEQLHNIRRVADAVDGVTIRPGMEFSFNRTVGECTSDRGFASAPTIIEGKIEDSPGGGVCQASSTLYNAALLAGMEIVERNPHSSPVHSVPPGRDATVVFGGSDLRFRNTLSEPVTIRAGSSGGRLSIRLTGRANRGAEYRIAVENNESVRPVSSSRGSGRTRFRTATVWREKVERGKVINREFVSSDTYKMVQ